VQAIRLGSAPRLLAFARGLQRTLPVNARYRPEPGSVPGYRDPVVMSSGAFIAGAVLTPTPDMFNQTLMAGSLIILYEGGIISARLFGAGCRKATPTP